MRLSGRQVFIRHVLSGDQPKGSLEFLDEDEALERVTERSRVSRLFPFESSKVPVLADAGNTWLFFAGPIDPATLRLPSGVSAFLGLGIYNIAVLATTRVEADATRDWLRGTAHIWEEWRLASGLVESVACSHPPEDLEGNFAPFDKSRLAIGDKGAESLPAYLTAIRTTLARAKKYSPALAQDLLDFHVAFSKFVSMSGLPEPEVHSFLSTAAAGISRVAEQALAGTTPIGSSESRYGRDSFLGLGTAVLALGRIRRTATDVIARMRYYERLEALGRVNCDRNLLHLHYRDDFWLEPHLTTAEVDAALKEEEERQLSLDGGAELDPSLPLLTFLSARDSYRATELSLSAPFEVLSCANTEHWSLRTLTHELSHSIVHTALGVILPPGAAEGDAPGVARELRGFEQALVNAGALPQDRHEDYLPDVEVDRTLLERLRTVVCRAIWSLTDVASDDINTLMQHDLTPASYRDGITRRFMHAEEVMAHCFDFVAFYGRKPTPYVRGVWKTWAALPGLNDRTMRYLVRCAAAISSNYLQKPAHEAAGIALDELAVLLRGMAGDDPSAHYIQHAVSLTVSRRRDLIALIVRCRDLVAVTKYFLCPEFVALPLQRVANPGAHGTSPAGLELEPLAFTAERVRNPLAFITSAQLDGKPSPALSAWMLHLIAFGGDT